MTKTLSQKTQEYYLHHDVGNKDYKELRWGGLKRFPFKQTNDVLIRFLSNKRDATILEIGPGSGVWTPLIVDLVKPSKMDLIDISKNMLEASKTNLKAYKNKTKFRFILGDFIKNKKLTKYDLIVTVRALEYFDDKEKAVEKMSSLLNKNGEILIITKNPNFIAKKIANLADDSRFYSKYIPNSIKSIFRTYKSDIQSDWISYERLEFLMKLNGFSKIKIFPVVIGIYHHRVIWKIFTYIHKYISKIRPNFFTSWMTESYLVFAQKER